MPRPEITARQDPLRRIQLDAVLDWLEANGGGASSGSITFDDGAPGEDGVFIMDEGSP
jgi:hypothetical protein